MNGFKSKEIAFEKFKELNPKYFQWLIDKEKKKAKALRVRLDRMNKIKELRDGGKTLEEIAKIFGVSRERVRQIGLSIEGWVIKIPAPLPEVSCGQCGKVFKIQRFRLKNKKNFCSKKCYGAYQYEHRVVRTQEEIRAFNAKRHLEYYHRVLKHNPKWRAKHKKKCREYSKNNKEKFREYAKEHRLKNIEAHRERDRKKYHAMKNDPVRYKKYRESKRRWYLKSRNNV